MKRKQPPELVGIAFETFAEVQDPRIDRTKLHPLMNVLVMALCGAIAGANGWDELALFARSQLPWFAEFLEVPHGTPSADTFRRVFEALDPRELESALRRWVERVGGSMQGEVVAFDGKSLKSAIDKAGSTTPLHMLHAWATGQQLLLAHQRVDGSPGEVGGIPELLKRIRIEGATVTTDANGCTKEVTAAIRDAKADYVLALKGNRGPIHAEVVAMFKEAESRGYRGTRVHRSKEEGHGREEERVIHALPLPPREGWRDAKTAVMVDRTRRQHEKTSTERSYYIASLSTDASRLAWVIRSHWGIENNLHWLLDVAFDEDSRRIRDEHSAENWALVTKLALMMLKHSPEKLSVAMKRKKAAWDPSYLARVLAAGI